MYIHTQTTRYYTNSIWNREGDYKRKYKQLCVVSVAMFVFFFFFFFLPGN